MRYVLYMRYDLPVLLQYVTDHAHLFIVIQKPHLNFFFLSFFLFFVVSEDDN